MTDLQDSSFKLTPPYLRNLLIMSDKRRLLVEGPDDKIAFELLLKMLYGEHEVSVFSTRFMKFDEIEAIAGSGETNKGIGNRQKVERICRSINGANVTATSRKGELVGFVDRDFDEFDWKNNLVDHLGKHQVFRDINLVLSRGHSLENYLFDFAIVNEAFEGYTEYFDQALKLFERHFEDTIRLACAATLAGKAFNNNLEMIRNSLDWKLLKITATNIKVETDLWRDQLQGKFKLTSIQVQEFISLFQTWQKKVEDCDFEIIRWLCHGHIGFTFIVGMYTRCVFEICASLGGDEQNFQLNRVRKFGYNSTLNNCVTTWGRRSKTGATVYPHEVFQLLRLTE